MKGETQLLAVGLLDSVAILLHVLFSWQKRVEGNQDLCMVQLVLINHQVSAHPAPPLCG